MGFTGNYAIFDKICKNPEPVAPQGFYGFSKFVGLIILKFYAVLKIFKKLYSKLPEFLKN